MKLPEPIAIVGSGCRLPGEASNPSKLWGLLRDPRDVQSVIPPSRFNPDGVYHKDNLHHGSANVRHAYLLSEDHRHFDAQFFSIPPTEAQSMDPGQRILLETVYESLEAAGLRLEQLQGSQTAVYVGLMCVDYNDMLVKDAESLPLYAATGAARSIMANRVSYFFDWHGPSLTIDTACSSSLVAVHQAVQTLRSGTSRVAVAAGCNLILSTIPFITESKLRMLSPNGRSRMWSADADGYARGEGVAAVVLKTLSAALEDGDSIECIIRETGTNQDGRTTGITMPNASAQAALIRDTYKRGGLDLSNPGNLPQFFEAHGTGTPAGDPLEAEAISSVFFPTTPGSITAEPCSEKLYVGSIKTIIGHTEGTAGVASLLKASLALQNRLIPPNMLFGRLNPRIEPYYSNLEVPQCAIPWPNPKNGDPRRASVNSFGFGGSNCHAVLEEYVKPELSWPIASRSNILPFVFSAISEQSLMSTISNFANFIRKCDSDDLLDVAYTLSARRSRFPFRASFVGRNLQSICSKLEYFVAKNDSTHLIRDRGKGNAVQGVLGIFTGQGAQWATMGRELILASPAIQKTVNRLEQRLASLPEGQRPLWSLREQLLADPETSLIRQASVAQPLCTAVQIILVDLLQAAGVTFDAVVGHSSGEIGAAYAAGLLTPEDAICLSHGRGLFTPLGCGPNGETGAMMAVGTSLEDAKILCSQLEGRISVAAVNSSTSITLSGDADAIDQAKEILDAENKFARKLFVDQAYHSHHMLACSKAYLDFLCTLNIEFQKPKRACKWYSSVYAREMSLPGAEINAQYFSDNMLNPVLFSQALECAITDMGRPALTIEVGPHPALKGPTTEVVQELIGQHLDYCATLKRKFDDLEAISDTIGIIWAYLGLSEADIMAFTSFFTGGVRPKVYKGLPCYAWNHDRVYWLESRTSRVERTRANAVNELLGRRQPEDPENQFRWRNILCPRENPYLTGHKIQGQIVFPAAAYLAAALEAATCIAAGENIQIVELLDVVIEQGLVFEDANDTIETLVTVTNLQHQEYSASANFSFYSAPTKGSNKMVLNTHGRIKIVFGADDSNALPQRTGADNELIDVPVDRLYQSFSSLGADYERSFRSLFKTKRRLGYASGNIKWPDLQDSSSLLVHPGMLDAAIQSIVLASSWPGDGRNWTLHVPTAISRTVFNPHLLSSAASLADDFAFDSATRPSRLGIFGDVALFTDLGQRVVVLEGVQTMPLESPSSENDRQLFMSINWGPALPTVHLAADDWHATKEQYHLAYVLERVAHFYLQRLHMEFNALDSVFHEKTYDGLLQHASHVSCAVRSGLHQYADPQWIYDTEDVIEAEIARFPANIDLRVMRAIGQNISAVVRGEADIIEILREVNFFGKYYAEALGMSMSTSCLARTLGQLTHRYPHMNILEIGAGSGRATKEILRTLGNDFLSYTFTDIQSTSLEDASEYFQSHNQQMVYKVLDIEKDISGQGFQEYSYDAIVASFVLHAARDLKNAIRNVRRLLKPGGILLLLEVTNLAQSRLGFIFGSLPHWWNGADDGRFRSPYVEISVWDDMLRHAGFSGIDSRTTDQHMLPFPVSVMVSQALDPVVEFIRDPLNSSYESLMTTPGIPNLVIIGGTTPNIARITSDLEHILRKHCVSLSLVDSLEKLLVSGLAANAVVINLADLDSSIFKDLTAPTFQGLKAMYELATAVMWVTTECWDNNPHHSESVGFGRSMQVEMPHVHLQFLDLDHVGDTAALEIAQSLLRFAIVSAADIPTVAEKMLWTTESELAVRDGTHTIPRMKPNQEQNDRYNSSRRNITRTVDASNVDVEVQIRGRDVKLTSNVRQELGTDSIQLRSILSSVQVFGGQNLILAARNDTGNKVLALCDSSASRIWVSKDQVVECSPADDITFFCRASSLLQAYLWLEIGGGADRLCMVDPRPKLASAVEFLATSSNKSVAFVSTRSGDFPANWIKVHPASTLKELSARIPRRTMVVLNVGAEADVAARIASCLPKPIPVRDISFGSRAPAIAPEPKLMYLAAAAGYAAQSTMQVDSLIEHDAVTIADLSRPTSTRKLATASMIDWTKESIALVEVEPVHNMSLLRPDKTYWLAGLTGSLGISLCRWIIDHGGSNIAITSRNPKIDANVLAELRSLGATIEVYPGDIADPHSLRGVYDKICTMQPPIAGVVQGAMLLRDTLISEMTLDDMLTVMRPKVDGTRNLDELFSTNVLDFFVCLSSGTCVTGNLGQSNYSVANMYMTGLMAQRRRRGLAGSAVNLSAILGVGYVTKNTSFALQENLLKMGHVWISEEDFHTLFAESILAGRPDATISSEISTLAIIDRRAESKPMWASMPKFQHLVVASNELENSSGSQQAVPLKIQLCEAKSTSEVYEVLTTAYLRKITNMLQLDASTPAQTILQSSAADLGIDSLSAVELRTWFIKEAGVDMPVLRILGGATFGEIADLAIDALPVEIEPARSVDVKSDSKSQ